MTREEILRVAKINVCGHREQDYGSPEDNFARIANLWNAYLSNSDTVQVVELITPLDVAMMMALLKIARIQNGGGSGDSFVDLAGYAACGGEIATTNSEEIEEESVSEKQKMEDEDNDVPLSERMGKTNRLQNILDRSKYYG